MMTTIRRADSRDCEAMFSLAKAFAVSFAVERRAFDSSFAALLQAPDAFLAVAVRGEQIVGYLLGFDHHTLFANGRVAWVKEIMVSQEMRRHGIGRQLMGSFEAWAGERRARLVGLATRREPHFIAVLATKNRQLTSESCYERH